MTPVIETRAIGKSFGPVRALRDVSFRLEAGEIRALCGENGAGKSTLVKILTGVYQPDAGALLIGGQDRRLRSPQDSQAAGIAFVSQELSTAPHLSVLDNIWLGHRDVPFFHRSKRLRRRAKDVANLAGLDHLPLETPASALSLSERQLLEIARMLARNARILILDEPTATLSDQEIERVFAVLRRLRSEGCAVVFITHRLSEVFEICDSVTVLRNGAEVGSHGISDVTRDVLIEMMLGRPLEQMYPVRSHAAGQVVLDVQSLCVAGVFEDLSLSVRQGEIVCLAGQIGSGAGDAIRAVAGLTYSATGAIVAGGRPLRLASPPSSLRRNLRFVSEDRAAEGVFLNLPVRDNLVATQLETLGGFGSLSRRRLTRRARQLAGVVGFDERRVNSPMRDLSGGNQQKIALARSDAGKTSGVLLMNEPTRGVDVGARADIYENMRRLCHAGCAVLMMSTDIEEVVGLSDVVVTMYRGRIVGEYRGEEIKRNRILADITHQVAPPPVSTVTEPS